MKDNPSKYLIIFAVLFIGTYIAVVSKHIGLKRQSDNANSSSTSGTSDNLNTKDTLGVSNTSQTKDNLSRVQAEQSGSSPESGATSRLKLVQN